MDNQEIAREIVGEYRFALPTQTALTALITAALDAKDIGKLAALERVRLEERDRCAKIAATVSLSNENSMRQIRLLIAQAIRSDGGNGDG